MVESRQNKPPLRTYYLNWFALWDRIGRPALLGLPWTRTFARESQRNRIPNWNQYEHQYSHPGFPARQALRLPRDPATRWNVNPSELGLQDSEVMLPPTMEARNRVQEQDAAGEGATQGENANMENATPGCNPSSENTGTQNARPALPNASAAATDAPLAATDAPVSANDALEPAESALPIARSEPAVKEQELPDQQSQQAPRVQLPDSDGEEIYVVPDVPIVSQPNRGIGSRMHIAPRIANTRASARRARRAAQRALENEVPCENCGGRSCPIHLQCSSPCSACGAQGCFLTTCPRLPEKCICSHFPGHVHQDCPFACRRCYETDPDKPWVAARECQLHCAACGQPKGPGHDASTCSSGICLVCGGLHFAQDCTLVVCCSWSSGHEAVWSTKPGEPRPQCGCCMDCGYPTATEPNHECQWARGWEDKAGTTESGIAVKMRFPILHCAMDELHPTRSSLSLLPVREAGLKRVMEEKQAYESQHGPLAPGVRFVPAMPVIECPECFAAYYDGGDYQTQVPGIRRNV